MDWPKKAKALLALERNIQVLVFSSLIGTTGWQFWYPFLPLYVKFLGATMEELGFLFSFQIATSILIGVVSGVLADKIGRKKCILIGNTVGATNFFIMGLARNWLDLIPLLLVDTVAGTLIRPGMSAMIAESIPEEKRATAYATAMVIPSFAFVIGPAVGGYVSEIHGYRILFFSGSVLQYIMVAMRVKYLKETLEEQERTSQLKPSRLSLANLKRTFRELFSIYQTSPLLRALLIMTSIQSFAGNIAGRYNTVYMEEVIKLSQVEIGLLFSLSQLAGIILMIPSGNLADRIGRWPCILLGWIATMPLGIAFLFAKDFFQATVISVSTSLLGTLTGPAWSALTADVTPKARRATIMGTLNAFSSIFGIPGPAMGAYLWENYSPRFPFYASLLLELPSLALFVVYLRPERLKSYAQESDTRSET